MAKDDFESRQRQLQLEEQRRRRMHGLDEKTGRYERPPSGGGGINCFPKGTPIATPYGLSDISTLRNGDYVLAFDRETNALRARRILRKKSHGTSRLWMIHFSDGTVLRTTSAHCFSVRAKWVKTCNLLPGAVVACIGGDRLESKIVTRSEPSQEFEPVFNLVVESDFTFIAGGVLAHSFSYLRALRTFVWRVVGTLKTSHKLLRLDMGTVAIIQLDDHTGAYGQRGTAWVEQQFSNMSASLRRWLHQS